MKKILILLLAFAIFTAMMLVSSSCSCNNQGDDSSDTGSVPDSSNADTGSEQDTGSTDSNNQDKPSDDTQNQKPELLFALLDDGTYEVSCGSAINSTEITVPESYEGKAVTSVAEFGFADCSSLKTIVLPSTIKEIKASAFYGCSALTSLEIPNSVTVIGKEAFLLCSSLKTITIPTGVTEIGQYAFTGCYCLESISVDENNANYKSIDGNLYSADEKTLIKYAQGKLDTSFTVPSSVTKIDGRAFIDSHSLLTIEIPNGVTSIGDEAFTNCILLSTINIPTSVTSIGKSAFNNCSLLQSIVIPNSVTEIGESTFANCSKLTIYCEAENAPLGWSNLWNYSERPVEWGYTGE